ncbi:hypothetical protein FB45DRAFT_210041 [Roridomyces roridus]|uniref:Uncharacterized protein n=1 Tax=Roridomyces roridus TaxID=1738132 RepID=A0AAD7G0J2_9AGAR|nr:hypothetical protein FB45DRAFT_210041 [Roridomyces roridus]
MSVSTHTGSPPPSYSSSPPSSRFAPLPPLASLVTEYEVYYRIYTPSGAIPVKGAASRPDPFVGRILARSVPPPHRAGMLKRRILAVEGLPDRTISVKESPKAQLVAPSNFLESLFPSITSLSSSTPASTSSGTRIYASIYDSQPMVDDAVVVLTGDGRHGATPDNPLAIVLLEELSIEARNARPQAQEYVNREIPLDKYVYYRLYNRDGEVHSFAAFDSAHTALGRIERAQIIPPATVDSLKSCIARRENWRRIWYYADLYDGTAPRDPLVHGTSIGRVMGGDVNRPLMLVQTERKSGLFNRPAMMLKSRRFLQNEKICDIPQGTMMWTDGVLLKDFWCACVLPGLAGRAMLKRKWFQLLDE